jgi:putative hydrolase of the HAD superfamily
VRPILLDLDDTLVDDHGSTAVAFDAFVKIHRAFLDERDAGALLLEWRTVFTKHWARHERGEVSFMDQRRARVREFLGKHFTDAEADQAFLPYLEAYEASWQLLPGVAEFLARSADVPKVILTNGDRRQQLRKVAATGLSSHVLAVITPEDSGYWKPNHEMFLAGARCLGVIPNECIMVGDDPVRDIAPARELGMTCFEVKRGRSRDAFDGALSAA